MEAIEAQSGMCVCFPRSGPRADDGARLPRIVEPPCLSVEGRELIRQMTEPDAEARLSVKHARAHGWMQGAAPGKI